MSRPAISFIVPDIQSPVLGPVTTLASYLNPDFDVEIVGPDQGGGICPMYVGAFPYKPVKCPRIYRIPDYWWECRRIQEALRGDVIIAVKAFATTVPVALSVKRRRGAKVVAYLDEWDGALMARLSKRARVKRWLNHWQHPGDDAYCPLIERYSLPLCDYVISTTTALQKKFGGSVIPMGVDMEEFAPRRPGEMSALRTELGMQDKRLIVFGGVVRPHKGIEQILSALATLGDSKTQLLIVGPRNEHVRELENNERFAPYLTTVGLRPKSEMPKYLGMADLVVLPLNDDLLAQTQMPCKVFEAMSMAKPIIASDVADLSIVLNGCGWTVPAGDVQALANRIEWVFSHREEAVLMGRKAREKCKQSYSRDVVSVQFRGILNGLQRKTGESRNPEIRG